LLEIVSKLTELNYFNVYSDSIKKIEKDHEEELNKLYWYYRMVPKTTITNNEEVELFGPCAKEQIKEWVKSVYLLN